MPKPDAERIVKLVEEHRASTEELRVRMNNDFDLYKMVEYDAGEDYESYTSNQPRVYADKIMSWLVNSQLIIRMPSADQQRQERERLSAKERFYIGLLRSVDEQLLDQLLPSLRDQLAFFITVRGWYAGRALLTKVEDGSSIVDITPWDPMHTYWGMGHRGLSWACYKFKKTAAEIFAEYGYEVERDASLKMEVGHDVYDYYDREYNAVVVDGNFVKQPMAHGTSKVPVFLGVVGASPPIQGYNGSGVDDLTEYGESVFKPNRLIFPKNNSILSTMLELVSRSKKPPIAVRSRDGTKTLPQDPYKAGTELALGEGEDVKAIELLAMARDTGPFLGMVAGEIQRGSLPFSLYGELQFQLSGYAINTLRQSIDTVIQPRLRALENAYLKALTLVSDQYESGNYRAMQLSGRDNNRDWFDQLIEPEVIQGLGTPEIQLLGQLPQDDMAKMSMAQIAREGPVPLLPDIDIREKFLGVQDTDITEAKIKEQLAERMSPIAGIYTLISAAMTRGRYDLASIYWQELQQVLMQQQMTQIQMISQLAQLSQTGMLPGLNGASPGGAAGPVVGGGGQGPLPNPRGFPPQVMPNAMLGRPAPVPQPGAIPAPPPGQPRPGAQESDLARLAAIGLFPPTGGG